MENNPLLNNEANKTHVIPFTSLGEATEFLKDFWMAVDPQQHGIGHRVAKYSSEDFLNERERTHGRDRIVLEDSNNESYVVYVYGNNDTNQISDRAATFLREGSII